MDLALLHHNAGEFSKAEFMYHKILRTEPNQPFALHLLGVINHQRNENNTALLLIKKALTIKPDYAEAHNTLGVVFKDLNKLEEAMASYKMALSIKPNYAEARNNLGVVLRDLGKLDEAATNYRNALTIKPGYADALYNLGNTLYELGKTEEAISSYRDAINIEPDYAGAYSGLGNIFQGLGKLDEAVASLKQAMAIEPGLPGVQHRLNALLGITTDCAPRKYVEEVFNSYATKFDTHLVNKLKYKTPSLLKEKLLVLGGVEKKLKNVIDIGCGTGLAGLQFRDVAETLIGIDLSENMVRKAEIKNIYDELYVDDIVDRLEVLKTKFNLFISSDVFTYIGNLFPLFHCIKKHSTQKSLFLFSTEHTDGERFILNNSGRYAHSKDYIMSAATQSGFKLQSFTKCNLRYEKDAWVIGGIYVLKG